MSYTAFITKVQKTIPIQGADNIQTAIVLGNQVVVSKEVKEGYLGVFFPADCQLSDLFCYNNNLYRDSTKNLDQSKKGFFENSRRVRCQPFLKVKSEGYFCGLESFEYLYQTQSKVNIEKDYLQDGKSFDKVGDEIICQKYISENTRRKIQNQLKNGKKVKTIETPMFTKHIDTDQFDYYVDNIPKGALLSFHAKVHGCFQAGARVKMVGGGTKSIQNVVKGDKVIGYHDGKPLESIVLNTMQNGKTDTWQEITTEALKYKSGNSFYKISCTPNHEINTPDGYVPASNIIPNSYVLADTTSYIPSQSQWGVLIGSYLGDGYFSKSGNMQFCHKKLHEDYVNYKKEMFSDLRLLPSTTKISGYGSEIIFSMLPAIPYVTHIFGDAQDNKAVCPWMVERATTETLAIIYMDDGSLSHSEFQKDRANISCCGIPDEGMDNYLAIFNKFGLYPVRYKDAQGFNRIRFNTKEAYKLWDMIAPYIIPCMQYKLPVNFKFPPLKDIPKGTLSSFVQTIKVISNERVITPRKRVKYDIETTTGNYVVSNILVHNSSARMAYTKVVKLPTTLLEKIFHKLGLFKDTTWEYIIGTRNVTLYEHEVDKDGFHGSEQFRFDAMDKVKPYLEKGMTIYAELSGYANTRPIMGTHDMSKLKDKAYTKKYGKTIQYSYNCKETETRLDIYRISYTNESGQQLDFTYPQMKDWCDKYDLNCSMLVADSYIYTGTPYAKKKLIEQMNALSDRPELLTEDYYDPTHINEGVVLRVDHNGLIPKFYKKKSYAFKVLENIFRDDNVDIEDAS